MAKYKINAKEILKAYADNFLSALRTSGGLLVGNSALVYLEIIGGGGLNYDKIALLGVILALIGSLPVSVISNSIKKEK